MITVARLTILELFRRRIIWLLVGLTVVSVALVALGVGQLVGSARSEEVNELAIRVGVSQVLILIAFMFSFVLAMTAAFLAAPAVGGDIESGLALALLARPLRRSDLLLGRWLGLAAVVVGYTLLSGALAIAVVVAIAGFGPPHPALALAFLSGQALVLMTLTLALGTVLPAIGAGAVAVLAFGVGWMAGVMSAVAAAFELGGLARVAEASRWLFPSDGLWQGVIYGLESPAAAMLAAGRSERAITANPFFTLTAPSLAFIAWSVVWVLLVLALVARRLSRRDL